SIPHMVGGTGTRLTPEILSRYTGIYEYAPGSQAMITFEGDLLFLQEGSNPLKLPLVPNSETVFVSRTNGDRLEFIKDSQGTFTEFTYHGGENDRRAVRKPSALPNARQ